MFKKTVRVNDTSVSLWLVPLRAVCGIVAFILIGLNAPAPTTVLIGVLLLAATVEFEFEKQVRH